MQANTAEAFRFVFIFLILFHFDFFDSVLTRPFDGKLAKKKANTVGNKLLAAN